MSNTSILYGATVKTSTDGGTTWIAVPEAKGVAIPTDETDYKDVTHLQSPGRRREFIPGLIDGGEISIPCNYTPTGYAAAIALQKARKVVMFQSTLPLMGQQTAGDVFVCSGYVTASVEDGEVDGEIMFNYNIRTTGDTVYTVGAGL